MSQSSFKPGDKVRILWGQRRGKVGTYLYDYRGRAVVQYGPSRPSHTTKLKYEHIEAVKEIMAGGKSVKTKGDAGEREIVRMFGGERTHWQPGINHGDVINVPYLGRTEVKRRAAGFKQIYDWLNDNDALFMRADRRQWLVCMRAKDLKLLLDELDELKHALKTLPVGQNEQSNIVHG